MAAAAILNFEKMSISQEQTTGKITLSLHVVESVSDDYNFFFVLHFVMHL